MTGATSATKTVTLKLRITRPWLAERKLKDIRKFDVDTVGDKLFMSLDLVRWRWAIKEALDGIGVLGETDIDYIGLPASIPAPSFRLYKRIWDPKDPGKQELFQCIPSGTVLTIPLVIFSSLPDNPMAAYLGLRPPTEEEIRKCFSVIGESIGLSPFGSRFGYGRFILE